MEDFFARMLAVADQFEAEATQIEDAPLGGHASDVIGEMRVSADGVVTALRLAERALRLAPSELSDKLLELHRAASADALRANLAVLPPQVAAEVAEAAPAAITQQALRDEAEGRPAGHGSPIGPGSSARRIAVPGPDDRLDFGPGVDAQADPQVVMAQLKAQVDRAVQRQREAAPAIRAVTGRGEAPAQRPNVRASVNAAGVPGSIAVLRTPTELDAAALSAQVLAALDDARRDASEQVARIEAEFGVDATPADGDRR